VYVGEHSPDGKREPGFPGHSVQNGASFLEWVIDQGKEAMRCLVWTDTWLKRRDKWEIIAVQDTAVPCK